MREIKSVLEIDQCNTAEDKKLLFLIEQSTDWIGETLNRPGFGFKQRVEYYRGTGTQRLLLKSRPVFTDPLPQVFVDRSGYYGSGNNAFDPTLSQLTYGTDFCLQLDQEDGSSRSGILLRLNEYWPKPTVRAAGLLSPFIADDTGSIKVIYTGGYTLDTMPAQIRLACTMLVARLRYVLPIGVELASENYEERSISAVTSEKQKLLALVWPLISSYRNWKW